MDILLVIGRVLFGGFFLVSGMNHFMKINDMAAYAQMKKVPMAKFSVMLTGLLLIVGGLSVVFNYEIHYGYALLVIFLVPTTFIMHQFWAVKEDKQQMMVEMTSFMKNIALLGAVVMGLASTWPI
ncbi:MAG: DoxX family protein [Candidatus Kerfeldbacteria bacterium CG15_BIG_FIL_POST_REV_8_21_14_020_45_12]|uniref:DoxX family protein n=1 Tax=Candidatus Kerfeldbacteria bacterium CG15_BIG_FIL_POST_REV_8_21_14_020_45_12 TaxID=2014247 RepID=A0A2M7H2S8_9BACT|nr:MAG: DoxX family protein [Candidatus Kerfeldbacteria bacterium CG15_BIG_FIL_POST_REV_8_21_14_020_45_12]PJA93233.1 MAG: DoxX family protein [Candidatus Kerfeldbacteria bacterium CG_4_9_14_3_um_filter_45_8]